MGEIKAGHFQRGKAAVTFRCTLPSGRDVSIDLCLSPEAATASRAWLILSARFGQFDPRTMEIETRESNPATGGFVLPGQRRAGQRKSTSVPCW